MPQITTSCKRAGRLKWRHYSMEEKFAAVSLMDTAIKALAIGTSLFLDWR
ncbi:hypothetical protein [Methyloglobulus sp.]